MNLELEFFFKKNQLEHGVIYKLILIYIDM